MASHGSHKKQKAKNYKIDAEATKNMSAMTVDAGHRDRQPPLEPQPYCQVC
jgi:hypothetical protein